MGGVVHADIRRSGSSSPPWAFNNNRHKLKAVGQSMEQKLKSFQPSQVPNTGGGGGGAAAGIFRTRKFHTCFLSHSSLKIEWEISKAAFSEARGLHCLLPRFPHCTVHFQEVAGLHCSLPGGCRIALFTAQQFLHCTVSSILPNHNPPPLKPRGMAQPLCFWDAMQGVFAAQDFPTAASTAPCEQPSAAMHGWHGK